MFKKVDSQKFYLLYLLIDRNTMEINVYPLDDSVGGDLMQFCIKEAKAELPEWYRDSSSYTKDVNTPHGRDKHMTIKKCMPVLDYLSLGLNLHTPSAIYVEGEYPNNSVTCASNDPLISLSSHHQDQTQKFPISSNYDPKPLKIEFPFSIETPSGYSSVFIAANDQKNFPLLFPSGMVQTDKYRAPVNFPFFVRKDFEGKIDAGTLFMKVLFVKREDVSVNYKEAKEDNSRMFQHMKMVTAFGSGFYKKLRLGKL